MPTAVPSLASSSPSPHTFLVASPLVRPARLVTYAALTLFALGLLCRAVRYFMQFPYWGDEGMLAVNFLDRDYAGLTKMLDNAQIAPVLFLWGEATALRLLGSAEWSLRLLPFVASLGALFLFWRLARLTLSPLAVTFAVGFLAVARWPVTMGAVVKPYSFDLFLSLALLLPAAHWLRRPQRIRWLALLAAVVPVSLMGSYPAVFVAGAVSVALLPTVWRRRSAAVVSLYLVYNVLMTATFLGCFLLVGREQLDPVAGSVGDFMLKYWADGFPPSEPWPLVKWFALINTGRLMAYPAGDSNGGSTLTLLLFLGGAWRFWKDRRFSLLTMCLLPFALNLFAAVLRRYPYGACGRLSQHLAPAICLLAGCGAAALLETVFRSTSLRLRCACVLWGLLVASGIGQLFYDVGHPFRDDEGQWTRKLAKEVKTLAVPGDGLVVVRHPIDPWALLHWQLLRDRRNIVWTTAPDWSRIDAPSGRVWVLSLRQGRDRPAEVAPPPDAGWVRVDQARFTLRRACADDPDEWCTLTCWDRAGRAGTPPVISCWP